MQPRVAFQPRPRLLSGVSGHHSQSSSHCRNCGTALQGPYCHRCGQHDFDFHRSFGHVALEALENFLHFDGKLLRNMVTLLFSPGRLTDEFNQGRRMSQMPPFRLYLFISVLFFFVTFQAGSSSSNFLSFSPESRADVERQLSTPGRAGDGGRLEVRKPDLQITGDREVARRVLHALDHQRELAAAFLHGLPRMLLVCLPLFALYLRILYRKSGYNYLQQLVVALHFHAFLYLWVLVVAGWTRLVGLALPGLTTLLWAGGVAWLVLYPVFMLRRLFPRPWRPTLLRGGLLFAAHAGTLAIGLLATAWIAFLVT